MVPLGQVDRRIANASNRLSVLRTLDLLPLSSAESKRNALAQSVTLFAVDLAILKKADLT
jgi:hypothetical protein